MNDFNSLTLGWYRQSDEVPSSDGEYREFYYYIQAQGLIAGDAELRVHPSIIVSELFIDAQAITQQIRDKFIYVR